MNWKSKLSAQKNQLLATARKHISDETGTVHTFKGVNFHKQKQAGPGAPQVESKPGLGVEPVRSRHSST